MVPGCPTPGAVITPLRTGTERKYRGSPDCQSLLPHRTFVGQPLPDSTAIPVTLFLPPARWLATVALGLTLTAPAWGQTETETATKHGFFDPAPTNVFFTAGYQIGAFTAGAGNMAVYSYELNRNAASVQTAMDWQNRFGGVISRLIFVSDHLVFGFGWSNRHIIHEARYTDDAGQKWRTSFRERLDELSLELGYPLWGGRLRPGGSVDFGLFRVSRRDGKDDDKGKWHTFHDGSDTGLLAPGQKNPTAGLTLFCDLAPLGKYGGGLTLRPYYQLHIMQPDLFGIYGTRDDRSYQYRINNFGLSASWAFKL